MRLILACLAALLLAGPVSAQRQPEWRTAIETDIILHPFRYEPRTLRLVAGRPVLLRFVNNGRANLSFRAPRFFAAALVRPRDRRFVVNGGFRLRPGERLSIALVPAPGVYRARSGYLLHRLRGMSARIIVE
ncbi:MAG TPA: cupredoxin domain-containing protein [Allosphingosinicella sp.]|nr:cupredoxin domain-containing protein [Allosphingosinicella sp.]